MPIVRNNLFALVMALELDLRSMVESGLPRETAVLSPDESSKALRRRTADAIRGAEPEWPELLPYLDLSELLDVMLRHSERLGSAVGIQGAAFKSAIEPVRDLVPIRNRVCHARLLEPEDPHDAARGVRGLGIRLGDHYRLAHVAEYQATVAANPQAYAGTRIPSFWQDDAPRTPNNLPDPDFADTGFVGRANDRESLARLLIGAHPIITVTGEGGSARHPWH